MLINKIKLLTLGMIFYYLPSYCLPCVPTWRNLTINFDPKTD